MRLCHSQLDKEQRQDRKHKGLDKPNEEFKGIQRHRRYVWHKEHHHHQERLPGKDVSEESE